MTKRVGPMLLVLLLMGMACSPKKPAGAPQGPAGEEADDERPQPFPADVRAAWEKAGAESGWMVPTRDGAMGFRPGAEGGKEGEVPAFQISFPSLWGPGLFPELPAPPQGSGFASGTVG